MIASILAARPNKCTGTIALVFGVMAFLIPSIEIFIFTMSTSTKTGVNCSKAITSTVAAKVKSAVITSSPGFKSNPIIAICKASVPLAHGITCFTPRYSSKDFWNL
ncbi:hypothetical protein D3C80_1221760 [compost metagenome]